MMYPNNLKITRNLLENNGFLSNDVPQVVIQTYYYYFITFCLVSCLLLYTYMASVLLETTQSNYFMATGKYYIKRNYLQKWYKNISCTISHYENPQKFGKQWNVENCVKMSIFFFGVIVIFISNIAKQHIMDLSDHNQRLGVLDLLLDGSRPNFLI